MPAAPAAGTVGTAPAAPGGPLDAGKLVMPMATLGGGSSSSSGPLLVTSGSSRATYNDNVTKLNGITSTLAPLFSPNGQVQKPGSLANSSPGVDTNYYMKAGEGTDQYNARIAAYRSSQAASEKSIQTTGKDETTPAKTTTGADGNTYNTDGSSTTTTTGDGSSDIANGALKAGIDPTLVKAFNDNYTSLTKEASDASATLEAAKATAANDPALAAAISQIQAQFGQLLDAMNAKNAQLLGRANTSVAAFGGLGQMSQSFLNDEQQGAMARIGDLQAKESALILKTQMAYQSGDIKAVNAAMKEYDNALAAKQKAVLDLQTKINDAVKTQQAQAKADATSKKQELSADISRSTHIADTIAQQIEESGVTDPGQIQQFIHSMAQTNGITNPTLLESAVAKARQTAQKAAISAANTADSIKNRDARTKYATNKPYFKPAGAGGGSTKGSGNDGGYSFSGSDVNKYKAFLAEGGKGPDGRVYAKQGDDTYSDPNAYVAAMNDWVNNKGTAAGFAKKFAPKTYVNPASYSMLPAAIRPATKASSNSAGPPP